MELPSESGNLTKTDYLAYILQGKYFHITTLDKSSGKVTASCVNCSSVITGNIRPTSNFITHLKTRHPKLHEDYQQDMKDPRHKNVKAKQSTLPYQMITNSAKSSRTETLVTNYIINSMSPLSTVEDSEFQKLIKGLCEEAKIPDRQKLKRLIFEQLEKRSQSLIANLDKAQYYCITADIWSSMHRSFFGATIHWIDPSHQFQRQSAVLCVRRFVGSHTFESITEHMLAIFEKYRLSREKITCVVTDNGSNFVKTFKEYGVQYEEPQQQEDNLDVDEVNMEEFPSPVPLLPDHERCKSHTIRLIATTNLDNAVIVTPRGEENFKKVFRTTMAKCNTIWNAYGRSVKQSEEIHKICNKGLIRLVVTRWNSTFDYRLLEFKDKLPAICNIVNVQSLSSTELKLMECYQTAMKPVAFALDKLQGEKSFYYGYFVPVILQTVKKLTILADENKQFSSPIARALLRGFNSRFESVCALNLASKETTRAIFAAVSLPYFKLRWIQSDKREEIRNAFIKAATDTFGSFDTSSNQMNVHVANRKDAFFDFDEAVTGSNNEIGSSQSVELECLQYFQDPSNDLASLIRYPICPEHVHTV